MTRSERLEVWVKTLSQDKKNELLVTCVDLLVDSEMIGFWEDTKTPYWDGSGEDIDNTEGED